MKFSRKSNKHILNIKATLFMEAISRVDFGCGPATATIKPEVPVAPIRLAGKDSVYFQDSAYWLENRHSVLV